MSATGKSTLVVELRRRGFDARDADDHGFTEPRQDGRWGWKTAVVRDLLDEARGRLLFYAGCSEEQAHLPFDVRVLLTAPPAVIVRRLSTRTNSSYGREADERAQVLADLADVEPLLERDADLIVDATLPIREVAEQVLAHIGSPPAPSH